MALTVRYCLEWLKHQLGSETISSKLQPLEILNDAGQHFFNMHTWQFAQRRQAELTLTAGQDYLPLPSGFREMVSEPYPATSSNSLIKLTSLDHVNKLRASGTVTSNHYWAAVNYSDGRTPILELYPTPSTVAVTEETRRNVLGFSSRFIDGSDETDPEDVTGQNANGEDVYDIDMGAWTFGCDNTNNPDPLNPGEFLPEFPSQVSMKVTNVAFPIDTLTTEHDTWWLVTKSHKADGNGCIRQQFTGLTGMDPENWTHNTGTLQADQCLSLYIRYHNSEYGKISIVWRNGASTQPTISAEWRWVNGVPVLNSAGPTFEGGNGTFGLPTDAWSAAFQGIEEVEGHPGVYRVWVSGTCKPAVIGVGVRQVFLRPNTDFHAGVSKPATVGMGHFFCAPQLEDGVLAPTAYQPTDTRELRATETSPEFKMFYRADWARVEDDSDDTIPIPDYCNGLFLQVLSDFALGYEERDQGLLSRRLAETMAGPQFDAAIMRDGEGQITLGEARGGRLGMVEIQPWRYTSTVEHIE